MKQALHLLMPADCRSEAFAEDLLDLPPGSCRPPARSRAWRSLLAPPAAVSPRTSLALAMVLGVAAVFGLGASSRATVAPGQAATVLVDQARAEAGLPELGDAPGFPVTIRLPARVQLQGDLQVPAGHRGIVVEADGVVLDLGGHHVQGALRCDAAGSCLTQHRPLLSGVQVLGQGAQVRHGRISGFAGDGLRIARSGRLQNLQLHGNAGHGLHANTSAAQPVQVQAVVAVDNGGAGIWLQNGRIEHSHSRRNAEGGFTLGALAMLVSSSAALNRGADVDGGRVLAAAH